MNTYILLYHALDATEYPSNHLLADDRSVVVNADDFSRQLDWLKHSRLPVVSLPTLFNETARQLQSTEKVDAGTNEGDDASCKETAGSQVVITFDDGAASDWGLAMPRLLDHDMSATFYVVSDWVNRRPGYMTSSQLREMAACGMNIGSHAKTHRFLPLLNANEVRTELWNSKACLEDILGAPVLDLAFPGGHYTRDILHEAQAAGYRSVATCRVGIWTKPDGPFELPRLEIRRDLSLDKFAQTFCPQTVRWLKWWESAKSCVRSTLGLRHYTAARRIAHRILPIRR